MKQNDNFVWGLAGIGIAWLIAFVMCLSLIISGCGSVPEAGPDDPVFRVQTESYTTQEAIEVWNIAIGYEMLVEAYEGDYDVTITLVEEPPLPGKTGAASGDLEDGEACVIKIKRSSEESVELLLHELGHCLGLSHNLEDPEALMAPHIQYGAEPSETEAEEVRRLHNVN